MPSTTPIRQSQITRAVKAVQAAGVPVGRVEIGPDGTINIHTDAGKVETDDDALNEWLKKNARET